MNVKDVIICCVVSLIVGIALSGFGTYLYLDSINSRQLADANKLIGEYRDTVAKLERDYLELGKTKDGLIDDNRQLREDNRQLEELNGRAKEEISSIGRTIDSLSVQGKNINEQFRGVITALKEIETRARVLENLYNSDKLSSVN